MEALVPEVWSMYRPEHITLLGSFILNQFCIYLTLEDNVFFPFNSFVLLLLRSMHGLRGSSQIYSYVRGTGIRSKKHRYTYRQGRNRYRGGFRYVEGKIMETYQSDKQFTSKCFMTLWGAQVALLVTVTNVDLLVSWKKWSFLYTNLL